MKFSFGKNWQAYSKNALTKKSLMDFKHDFDELFNGIDFKNKKFIDIGFGQGLAILIAAEKGADVVGIDIDANNIKALNITLQEMGRVKVPKTDIVSILDDDYVNRYKSNYDIVHSWGVLHHTGNMTKGFDNACDLVATNGYFICSIYNRHWSSPIWKIIKYLYNISPLICQQLINGFFYPIIFIAKWIVTGKNPKQKERGMNFFYDVIDWIGGYPYEYATENEIIELVSKKGFVCIKSCPAAVPTGCNEFVFERVN